MTEEDVALIILLEVRETIIVIIIARSQLSSLEDQSDHVHLLTEFVLHSVHLLSHRIQSLLQRRSRLRDRKTHVQLRSRTDRIETTVLSVQSVLSVMRDAKETTETITETKIVTTDVTITDLATETIEITTDHHREETTVQLQDRLQLLKWHLLQILRVAVVMTRKRRTTIEITT
jgi:hypothetical protein